MATVKTFYPELFKIPVAGPAPYNTLVVVNQWFFSDMSNHTGNSEDYFHYNVKVITPYVPSGFDPNSLAPIAFNHSTTFAFLNTGPSSDDHFLYAVDGITDAGFDPEYGYFYVSVDTVMQMPNYQIPQGTPVAVGPLGAWIIWTSFLMTSFVLVQEPQPDATLVEGSPSAQPWREKIKIHDKLLTDLASRFREQRSQLTPYRVHGVQNRLLKR